MLYFGKLNKTIATLLIMFSLNSFGSVFQSNTFPAQALKAQETVDINLKESPPKIRSKSNDRRSIKKKLLTLSIAVGSMFVPLLEAQAFNPGKAFRNTRSRVVKEFKKAPSNAEAELLKTKNTVLGAGTNIHRGLRQEIFGWFDRGVKAIIPEKLDFKRLTANLIRIGLLDIEEIDLENLDAKSLNVENASLNSIDANQVDVNEVDISRAELNDLDVAKIEVKKGKIDHLDVNSIDAKDISLQQAQIGRARIDSLAAGILKAEQALVNDVVVGVAHIKQTSVELAEISQVVLKEAELGNLQAITAEVEQLQASLARVNNVVVTQASVESFAATNAEIAKILAKKAELVEVGVGKANVSEAFIKNVNLLNASIEEIDLAKAVIDSAIADLVKVNRLRVEFANFTEIIAQNLTVGELNTEKARFKDLKAELIKMDELYVKQTTLDRLLIGTLVLDNIEFPSWVYYGGALLATGVIGNELVKHKALARGFKTNDTKFICEREVDFTKGQKVFLYGNTDSLGLMAKNAIEMSSENYPLWQASIPNLDFNELIYWYCIVKDSNDNIIEESEVNVLRSLSEVNLSTNVWK